MKDTGPTLSQMMQPRRLVCLLALVAFVGAACSSTSTLEDASPATTDAELVSNANSAVHPAPSTSTAPAPTTTTTIAPTTTEQSRAMTVNGTMGRGINFGNALDAPREGDWGVGLDASYFEIVADAGFLHVRLPVSWDGYADSEPPFTIPDGDDPTVTHPDYSNIWARVDWAIEHAAANGLIVIVNMHHYDKIHADPLAERDRFLAMWGQIAQRYSDAGDHVVFELLNEPHEAFDVDPALWNDLAAAALDVIRETNPYRPVLIGPVGYNSVDRLADLVLPDDPNLITTVHVYEPFEFTHQGATWVDPVPPVGTTWTPDEQALPVGVDNYSWDTVVTSEGDNLRLDYSKRYAGFSLDYQRGVSLTDVSFRASGKTDLRIFCRLPGGGETDVATLTTTKEVGSYAFALDSCANESTGLVLQSTSADPEPLVLESLIICSDRGCEEIVQTEGGAIDALIAQAADWAVANDVPMHVGEFGAYGAEGAAPLEDRAAWTRAVQDAATTRGMSTAYWEFHSGFGAWNPDTDEWIEPLRAALLD